MNYEYLKEDSDPTLFAVAGQTFGALWNNGLAVKLPVIGKYMIATVVAKEVLDQGSIIYRNYFEKAMMETQKHREDIEKIKSKVNSNPYVAEIVTLTLNLLDRRMKRLTSAMELIMKELTPEMKDKTSAFLSGLKSMTISQYSAVLKAVKAIAEDSSIASRDVGNRVYTLAKQLSKNVYYVRVLDFCSNTLTSCTKLDVRLVNDVAPLLGATVISVAANQSGLFVAGAQAVTRKAIAKGLITTASEGAILKAVVRFAALPVGTFTLGSDLLLMVLPFMLDSFQKVLTDTSQKLAVMSKMKQEFSSKLRKDINSYLDQTIQLCYQRKKYNQQSIDEIQKVGTTTGESVLLYTVGGYIKAFNVSCNGVRDMGVQARATMLRLKVLKIAGGEESRTSTSQILGGGFQYHTKEAGDQTLDAINKQIIDACYTCLASFEQTDGNLVSKLNETTTAINNVNKQKMEEHQKIRDAVIKNDNATLKVNDAISRSQQPPTKENPKQNPEKGNGQPTKNDVVGVASPKKESNGFYSLISNPNFAKGVAGVAASSILIYVLWKYGGKMFSKIRSWWKNLWSKDDKKEDEEHTK